MGQLKNKLTERQDWLREFVENNIDADSYELTFNDLKQCFTLTIYDYDTQDDRTISIYVLALDSHRTKCGIHRFDLDIQTDFDHAMSDSLEYVYRDCFTAIYLHA